MGYGTQTGFNASLGSGFGLGSGFETNLTSAGIGWSQSGGVSANMFGFQFNDAVGARFDPSFSVSKAFYFQKATVPAPTNNTNTDPDLYASIDGGPDANVTSTGGENAPNSAFTMRETDVDYQTLLNEFLSGTGPEYSGFSEGHHPMVNDLKKSWIVTLATTKYLLGGSKGIREFDVPFGVLGTLLSHSKTEQFIGGARVSIIPTPLGTVYAVNNTTGRYSGSYHMANDVGRAPGRITPQGNTYQRFMWIQK